MRFKKKKLVIFTYNKLHYIKYFKNIYNNLSEYYNLPCLELETNLYVIK